MTASSPPSWRRPLLAAAALALSLALLVALVARLDTGALRVALRAADWRLVGVAALASLLLLGARALRFFLLGGGRVPLRVVLAASAIHGFILRVAPMRLGELSLPYLLARHAGQPAALTVVQLVLARLLDLAGVILLALPAVALTFGESGLWRLWWAGPAMLAVAALLFHFRRALRVSLALATWLLGALGLARFAVVREALAAFARAVAQSGRMRRRLRVRVALATLLVVLVQFAVLGVLAVAFRIDVGLPAVVVAVQVAILAGALPIPATGNVGTHELAWTLAFVWVGASEERALVTGLASGFLSLAFQGAQAAVAALYLARRSARTSVHGNASGQAIG